MNLDILANQNPQIKRWKVSTKDTLRIFNPKHQFSWLTPTFLHPTCFRPVSYRFRLEQINFNFSSDKDKAFPDWIRIPSYDGVESGKCTKVYKYKECFAIYGLYRIPIWKFEGFEALLNCVLCVKQSNTLSSRALSGYLYLLTWHYTTHRWKCKQDKGF